MKDKNYVLLADAFGYGPITTLINISRELKKRNIKQTFVGPELCLNKIKKEHLCDEYIKMDYKELEIEKNKDYFLKADKIIAVETTDVLIYLIKKYNLTNIYLIDNLFWMWDFLEDELKKLKTYYISTTISCDENLKRIAQNFNNIKKVGSLRTFEKFHVVKENNLLISLGGAESYMFNFDTVNNYYIKCIDIILKNKYISEFTKIYIAGGEKIIDYIKKNRTFSQNITIGSYSNQEYLDILHKCSYAIMSPGLGNFNEIISTNINVMFLLPINYSQHLQRYKYKELDLNFYFQENKNENFIEQYKEETEGVEEVIKNLKKYDFMDFDKEVTSFIKSRVDDNKRRKFYNKINKNGIQEICNDLLLGEEYEKNM